MTNTVEPRLIVVDLDGTLLHDGRTFEERFLSQRSVDAIIRMHDAGYRFAIATARPVSTAFRFVERMPADAVAYLNGALIDYEPAHSDYRMLTGAEPCPDGHLARIGFTSSRACEVCRRLADEMPGLRIGIVMNDVRYTNFDVSEYWKDQVWRYTDFADVPDGIADKLIAFPEPEQWEPLRTLIPEDFAIQISEGTMWMLMNPDASKEHALHLLCERMGVPPERTAAFGDDLIDIAMMRQSGLGVAVANANPQVLDIADEICPSNNEDGVAQWIETHLL